MNGRLVFSKCVAPDKFAMLQWKAMHPSKFGKNKLTWMGKKDKILDGKGKKSRFGKKTWERECEYDQNSEKKNLNQPTKS